MYAADFAPKLRFRMAKERTLGRVLLVDGNAPVTRFLKLNLENSGYEVSVVHSVEEAEESAPKLTVSVIALASPVLAETREAVSRLRKALPCPVLVYGVGTYSEADKRSLNADHWVDRFYEPADFIRAIEVAKATTPPGGC
jgi:DNA-binding response OmpR family regulator